VGVNVIPAPNALRTSVTLAVCVPLFVVKDNVPLHVVPGARPDGFAETVKVEFDVLAVKTPVGERVNQVIFVQLCSEAWAVAVVLACAVTVSVCETEGPPGAALKTNIDGLRVRAPAAKPVTFNVTLAVCVEEPAIMEIVPLHVVPAEIPVGFTDTVKFVLDVPAVKLPLGDRISHVLLVQLCSET
jgi:hypothetical protein